MAYSPDEAAMASGQGRTKIYEAIGKGALKAKKAGRRTFVLVDDLRDWLDSLPEIKAA
jgi:hypothetical protein